MATVKVGLCVLTLTISEKQQKSVLCDRATALSTTITERREVFNTKICYEESVSVTVKERKGTWKLVRYLMTQHVEQTGIQKVT